jgi:branched-chain amino acid aminotransferase
VLDDADEVFITSTTRDISPVEAVDGRTYPAPGPVTARAQQVFAARSAADLDP